MPRNVTTHDKRGHPVTHSITLLVDSARIEEHAHEGQRSNYPRIKLDRPESAGRPSTQHVRGCSAEASCRKSDLNPSPRTANKGNHFVEVDTIRLLVTPQILEDSFLYSLQMVGPAILNPLHE